jgi:hypothetical protein
MKNLTKTILAVIGFISWALFSQQAQAMPMPSGRITFGGAVTYGTGGGGPSALTHAAVVPNGLATATFVMEWNSSDVAGGTGDFSDISSGASVTMAAPWVFNPSTSTPGLWSVGGFTFDLDSCTIVSQSNSLLHIKGIGTLSGEGFDPTTAIWNFVSTDPDNTFGFTSTTTTVPDAGTTAGMLGLALASVEVLRRKFKAA